MLPVRRRKLGYHAFHFDLVAAKVEHVSLLRVPGIEMECVIGGGAAPAGGVSGSCAHSEGMSNTD